MSLLKDLIPAVKHQLDADKEQFPNLHRAVIKDLENAQFITDIPLGTAHRLADYFSAAGLKHGNDSFLLNIYEIFGK